MWLGSHSVSALHQQLLGIRLAEDIHRINPDDRIVGSGLEQFEQWVEENFNPRRLTVRSYGLAREIAGDEAEGLDLWFSWLDQFRESL